MKSLRLPAKIESLEAFRAFVDERLEQIEVPQELQFKIELVLEEILTNVVHYAYPGQPGDIEVGCSIEGQRLEFLIQDWGVPFNPLERAEPDLTSNLSDRQVGGLGIFLIRHMVDDLTYRRQDDRNTLRFSFSI